MCVNNNHLEIKKCKPHNILHSSTTTRSQINITSLTTVIMYVI